MSGVRNLLVVSKLDRSNEQEGTVCQKGNFAKLELYERSTNVPKCQRYRRCSETVSGQRLSTPTARFPIPGRAQCISTASLTGAARKSLEPSGGACVGRRRGFGTSGRGDVNAGLGENGN